VTSFAFGPAVPAKVEAVAAKAGSDKLADESLITAEMFGESMDDNYSGALFGPQIMHREKLDAVLGAEAGLEPGW
jgi:hypothetical protein